MGLPFVSLTDSGRANWREALRHSGYAVRLDEAEQRRCERLGDSSEPEIHRQLFSETPILVEREAIVLRCIEVKKHDGSAHLVFVPRSLRESRLCDEVRAGLLASGVALKE